LSVLQWKFLRIHLVSADREAQIQFFHDAKRFGEGFFFAPLPRDLVPLKRAGIGLLHTET